MKRLLLTGAAALLLTGAGVAAPGHANELTQPRDGGSADVAFNTNLPADNDAAFTAPEYEGTSKRIGEATRRALVEMAIEAGQTSSKSADDEARADSGPPAGVKDHAKDFFGRVESRGVSASQG